MVNRPPIQKRIRQEEWTREPDKMRMVCFIGQEYRPLLHWVSELNSESNKGTESVLRTSTIKNTVELGYDVMKWTEYFVSYKPMSL